MAMDDDQLREIIGAGEYDHIERKRLVDLRNQVNKVEFTKDMLSLVNAHGEGARYLLIGVNDDGSLYDVGPLNYDDAPFRQLIDDRTSPPIQYTFEKRVLNGSTLILITIPRSSRRFHLSSKLINSAQGGPLIREGETFIKSGTVKRAPRHLDYEMMKEADRPALPQPKPYLTFENGAIQTALTLLLTNPARNTYGQGPLMTDGADIPLYIYNNGTANANEVIVELSLPDGCTVSAWSPDETGWEAKSFYHGVARPPRFMGRTIAKDDFAHIGQIMVQFSYIQTPVIGSVREPAEFRLEWSINAENLAAKVTGTLMIKVNYR